MKSGPERANFQRRRCGAEEASMSAVILKADAAPQQHPKDLYEIGEVPPLGHVPARMHAWAIRKERHGPPETSMQLEVVPTWPIGEDEVLVYVMAGGGQNQRRGGRLTSG